MQWQIFRALPFPTSSVKFCNLLPYKKLSFLQGATHTFTLLVALWISLSRKEGLIRFYLLPCKLLLPRFCSLYDEIERQKRLNLYFFSSFFTNSLFILLKVSISFSSSMIVSIHLVTSTSSITLIGNFTFCCLEFK